MKAQSKRTFKLNADFQMRQMALAVMAATASLGLADLAMAGPGFGDAIDQSGAPFRIPTYFANSPSGNRDTLVQEGQDQNLPGAGTYTGAALRKFVDPLPLPGVNNAKTMADGVTSKYIPVAVSQKWVNPEGKETGDDYYEIAVLEYSEKFHSDLKKATTMRGYVQIDHEASNGRAALPGSQAVDLKYPDGSPIMIQATDAKGKLVFNADGSRSLVQAKAVDNPHFLGPVIAATKGTPARVKFLNLLPVGHAETTTDANGKLTVLPGKRHGDLFLPIDPSLMGAGLGPDGATSFTQNRADIHLHGGDTPWISDGTPHQWITPAGEADPSIQGSLAQASVTPVDQADPTVTQLDPTYLPSFLRGASAVNVPDMNDPGPGAMTYYFPNGQSARMLWYHDHTAGMTRLNVYAGEAAGYILTDSVEQKLIEDEVLPPAARTIPLVLQDRTFVPDDIALQDAKWDTNAWGEPGDSWFPHVYETVQDPAQQNNWNAVGRWHYGPWFWPVFPAAYELPSGNYGDATTTPEAWMDTAIVNGVAYPTLEVDPTTYRFRILNASNDRMMTFNLFVADDNQVASDGRRHTEVPMIAASAPYADFCTNGEKRPPLAIDPDSGKPYATCTPDTWQFDNRAGGLPDPSAVGPTLYQIGSEGGFLPQVAEIEPTPISFLLDKGRATVLNVDTPALFMGPAERADVVVDFSQYAGKTLIVYNDSTAPIPAGDPRNDYFTEDGDQSAAGGAENTKAGYGPNTRTLMQIKVKPLAQGQTATRFDPSKLKAELPKAYKDSQERPVVGQTAYNQAFGEQWSEKVGEAYGSIYTGSLKEPQFSYVPGLPSDSFNSVTITNGGTGYTRAPQVAFSDLSSPGATGALAAATLKIDRLTVTNPGTGYLTAPQVAIVASAGGGSGATAQASLGVRAVSIIAANRGANYATAPAVTFSRPQDPTGVQATGTAVLGTGANAGKVMSVTITNPGKGYASLPTVKFSGGTAMAGKSITVAKGTADAGVYELKLTSPDPTNPGAAGGGGYGDLSQVTITFTGTSGSGATATASGKVFDVTMVNGGTGYTNATQVSFTGGGGSGAQAFVDTDVSNPVTHGKILGKMLVKTKAIQELFEPTYGRLNATLGVEIPFTSALTQTTIPLGYIDEASEKFADGETQIWKITHNGVDTHPVHFHLLNVQLINRVGWDGFVSPPAPYEVGWKDTVKMNPLEDVIVAVRAKRTSLSGFGLPNSVRPMDPTQPLGSPFGFTQIDPNSGIPKTMVNELRNYNWEYVWHCHILGHEENDFMRAVQFDGREIKSSAPTNVAVNGGGGNVMVSWKDPTPMEDTSATNRTSAAAEMGFRVERRMNGGGWSTLGSPWNLAVGADAAAETVITAQVNALANSTQFEDTSAQAPATLSGAPVLQVGKVTRNSIAISWSAVGGATGYQVYRNGQLVSGTSPLASITSKFTDTGLAADSAYSYTVKAVASVNYDYRVVALTTAGESASASASMVLAGGEIASAPVSVKTLTAIPATPSWVSAIPARSATDTSVTLTWLDNSDNESGFRIERCVATLNNSNCTAGNSTWSLVTTTAANVTSYKQGNVARQTIYQYRIRANGTAGNSAWVMTGTAPTRTP